MRDLDGAHCFRALCSHPCCWDAERRGVARISRLTPAHAERRSLKDLAAEVFPSLSIVNVSEWAGRRRPIKDGSLRLSSADTEASLNYLARQTKDTGKIKRAHLSFPESMLPISSKPTDTQNNTKLNTVHISPSMVCSELPQCPVVTWIRNPQHTSQWLHQNKSKSPNVAIKELICLPSCQMSKSSKAAKQKKRNVGKRRKQRGSNSAQEGAGTPQLVGIGFHARPKPPHHLSHSIHFKDSGCGSLDQKLPSLTTPHPNHSSSLSTTFSQRSGPVKCWRGD